MALDFWHVSFGDFNRKKGGDKFQQILGVSSNPGPIVYKLN